MLTVISIGFGLSAFLAARQGADSPEAAIRQLLRAMYANDVEAYNAVTTEHPQRARLTQGGRVNQDALRRLTEDPSSLQTREMRPTLVQGKPFEGTRAPVGATALYMAAHQGGPMAVPLVRRADGWKVDVRWWVAMHAMERGDAKPTAPEVAVRSMLAAILRLDRARAARYLTDARTVEVLFAGGPSYREPSGVLDAAVGEMALVEVGAGEFYPLIADRVVEGGSTDDRKVLVGLFGPIEIPFVVRRIGNDWKVEAQPYFVLMNQ